MIGSIADLEHDAGDTDICIVGAGPVGLTLAATLVGHGFKVLVLEAGGDHRSRASQAFFRGEIADPTTHPPADQYRVRALGGASSIWGGRAIPFDSIDFEARPWAPGSGWPFGRETLAPYYGRALEAAEAGEDAHTPSTALPGRQPQLAPGLDSEWLVTTIERFSRPTDFWRRYGPLLSASDRIRVAKNSAVVAARLGPSAAGVDHLEVAGPDGRRLQVRARVYVLAMGGFETTRLMMTSNDVLPHGLGNSSGRLGRFYMSHLCAAAAVIEFNGPASTIAWDYERDKDEIYLRRRLWVSEAAQRRFGVLNTTFRTHLPDVGDPSHGDAILSAMYLAKRLVLYEYARKLSERRMNPSDAARHMFNIARQPTRLADFGLDWTRRRILAHRKLPSVVLGSPLNRYALEFHAEQTPNADSRLSLTGERDRFGVQRLRVDWRVNETDFDSLERAHRLLAGELERSGAGRLTFDAQELRRQAQNGVVGGHHIGTTRMSTLPDDGVVDPDCRVHGLSNLYVAGSSTFPTSGQANPTLTALALGLRLADHLAADLRA